jgi:hypothetical protein
VAGTAAFKGFTGCWWLRPVILATQEGGPWFEASSGKTVHETPS